MQLPVHAPFAHVSEQATGLPQVPVALHVRTALPEHTVAPGSHATQAPSRHAGVLPEHGAPTFCWVPAAVQMVGCAPLHEIEPTVQAASEASLWTAASPGLVTSAIESTAASLSPEAEQVPPVQVSPELHAVPLQHGAPEAPQLVPSGPASVPTREPLEPPQLAARIIAAASVQTPASASFIGLMPSRHEGALAPPPQHSLSGWETR
jgi:hypothetical protein